MSPGGAPGSCIHPGPHTRCVHGKRRGAIGRIGSSTIMKQLSGL
jgi:hypothetical protein